MEITTSDQPEFWQFRYQEQRTPWDLGMVAPPFVELLQRYRSELPPGKMAVLGSGYGHDAAFFGQQGFEVIGFDYVEEAVQGAIERYSDDAKFVQADIFTLSSEYDHQFDYVLEQTCFCAILPNRRQDYAEVVKRLLKPGGYFIGLIWAFVEDDGPPYPSTEQEIHTLFKDGFDCRLLEVSPHSVEDRKNQEFLVLLRRQPEGL